MKNIVDNELESADAVSLVLALRHLLESASIALPETKPGVELALPGRSVLHKMIASKISHGYQLEFVTTGGESYFGFVIGLDSEFVQIWSPEGVANRSPGLPHLGEGFRINRNWDEYIESFDVLPVRHWLSIGNIETISENFLGVKHLTKRSQEELGAERRAMLRISERYLYSHSKV